MSPDTPANPPDSSIPAAAAGFRLPAEWEPLQAVWMTRPHDKPSFPGCFEQALTEWENLAARIREVVEVRETGSLGIPTRSSRIRDFGPVFLVHPTRGLAAQEFGVVESGDPDRAVPAAISRRCRIPMWSQRRSLPGGSFETDGLGTLLVAAEAGSAAPQAGDRLHGDFEAMLCETLGVSKVLGIPGWSGVDHSGRQLDDLARFVAPGVVAVVEAPPGHPDHAVLAANRDALIRARDARGEAIEVVPLPSPTPIHFDFPANGADPGGRRPLPASHANFQIANGRIFVPVFGSRSDDLACRRLEDASGLPAVAVMARHLVVGLGGPHRLTCPQPAAAVT